MFQLLTEKKLESAIASIPLMVSLIYKHRESEATMWKLIDTLAQNLRPIATTSITKLTSGFMSVKHADTLRTLHHTHHRDMLFDAVQNSLWAARHW